LGIRIPLYFFFLKKKKEIKIKVSILELIVTFSQAQLEKKGQFSNNGAIFWTSIWIYSRQFSLWMTHEE